MDYQFVIVGIYALLNLVVGLIATIYYLFVERRIYSTKEILLLLFVPAYGYGNWRYHHFSRRYATEIKSKKYFIYKNMIWVNILFSLLMFGLSCYIIYDIRDLFTAQDTSIDHDSLVSELLSHAGNLFYFIFKYMAIISFIAFQLFYMSSVIIPCVLYNKYKNKL